MNPQQLGVSEVGAYTKAPKTLPYLCGEKISLMCGRNPRNIERSVGPNKVTGKTSERRANASDFNLEIVRWLISSTTNRDFCHTARLDPPSQGVFY